MVKVPPHVLDQTAIGSVNLPAYYFYERISPDPSADAKPISVFV